jgi:hypothetical protein
MVVPRMGWALPDQLLVLYSPSIVLANLYPVAAMNQAAVTPAGLTQQSPNVSPIPDSLQMKFFSRIKSTSYATGVHVTLGK